MKKHSRNFLLSFLFVTLFFVTLYKKSDLFQNGENVVSGYKTRLGRSVPGVFSIEENNQPDFNTSLRRNKVKEVGYGILDKGLVLD